MWTNALWTKLNFPLGWIQRGVTNLQPLDKINLEIPSRDRTLWLWELPVEYLLGVTATSSWERSQRAPGCLSHTVPGSCYLVSVQLFHRQTLLKATLMLSLVLRSPHSTTPLIGSSSILWSKQHISNSWSCRLRWPPLIPHTCQAPVSWAEPGLWKVLEPRTLDELQMFP